MRKGLIFIFLYSFPFFTFAQSYNLGPANCGTTISACSGFFNDNGGIGGNYAPNQDCWATFCSNIGLPGYLYTFSFDDTFDIHPDDTLFIHDGSSIYAPLLRVGPLSQFYANNSNPLNNYTVQTISGCLTFRFKSKNHSFSGWSAKIECKPVCQNFIAKIDNVFYKIVNGARIPNRVRLNQKDYVKDEYGQIIDSVSFNSIDICDGDSIVLSAKTNYPFNNLRYPQSDATSIFEWSFGDSATYSAQAVTEASHRYTPADGYNLSLKVIDERGCIATDNARVRISWNPIRKINPLPDLCLNDTCLVSVGYRQNQIEVDTVKTKPVREIYSDVLFIPDGPGCPKQCYKTNVKFDQYPPGTVIQRASDICSVCITAEHTWSGDLGIYLVCPNGQKAALMTYNGSGGPYPSTCNGGADLGIPPRSRQVPGQLFPPDNCTQELNAPGIGWQYCWSEVYRNSTQGQMGPHTQNVLVIDSSDYMAKSKFFLPDTSFNSLIGCPLNGEWSIEICDYWAIDKGYIFNWSLEICNIPITKWKYEVLIDSVIWNGPFLQNTGRTHTEVNPSSPGNFSYEINILDDFSCQWDTSFSINVLPDVSLDLGRDTILCSGAMFRLDATGQGNLRYLWDNNSINPIRIIDEGGTYWAKVFRQECPHRTAIDTIRISYYSDSLINLGNDTALCLTQVLLLNATGDGNFTYLWSDSSTDTTLLVRSSGTYWVRATRAECPSQVQTDSIYVLFYPPFAVDLGMDTTICYTNFVLLDATQYEGNFKYAWSTGNTSPTLDVNKKGIYWVDVSRVECPEQKYRDSIQISHFPRINVDLGKDNFICKADSLLLVATQNLDVPAFYQWQDSSTNSVYTVWEKGQYWVSVYNLCERKGDTVNISEYINPYLHLPDDTSFCLNRGGVRIVPNINYKDSYKYVWSDGLTDFERIFNKEGLYWLEATNRCFSLRDSIQLTAKDCEVVLIFPTAITPFQASNNYFSIGRKNNVKDIKIWIYNRWGNLLYYSKNVDFKWDGRDSKGDMVPAGSYVYLIEYHSEIDPGIILQQKGNINVIY